MKIHPVAPELFHAEGQTDIPKLIVAICSFAKAPKTEVLKIWYQYHRVHARAI